MFDDKMKQVPLKNIKINDKFWSRYIDLVKDVIIDYQWKALNDQMEGVEKSHSIENFKIVAGVKEGDFHGMVFQDTDVAKWLEAVAYSLESNPNEELEKTVDDVIDLIEKAQNENGYLNTYFTLVEPERKWANLLEGHELYTAGHFIEAAVAYYQATGKDKLLNIMRKFADYIAFIFGPGDDKIHGYPGHQEIELALVKLYNVTGDKKYIDLANYFINQRGKKPYYFDEERKKLKGKYIFPEFKDFDKKYNQTHLPVLEQTTAEGHAVRAVYMYTAMADLAYVNKNEKMLEVCERLYSNIVNRRMYITGSIGSAKFGERFTCDYDLPNDTNYSETCASIGLAMFSQRMLQITHNGKYGDTLEKALYNTILAGISAEGTAFFYVNPLEVWPESCENNPTKSHVKTERQKWFGVACCPPNITRTLASLGQYIYGVLNDAVYVNLFVSNKATLNVAETDVTINQITKYPFENTVEIIVESDKNREFTLAVRIPQWCETAELKVDKEKFDIKSNLKDGYVYITKEWNKSNKVQITFDMTPRLVFANPKVRVDEGKAAITKGPLVYCLEECDNGDNLSAIEIKPDADLKEYFDKSLLGGTQVISLMAKKIVEQDWNDNLYRFKPPVKKDVTIKAVPYCLWNNRKKGEMLVWIRLN